MGTMVLKLLAVLALLPPVAHAGGDWRVGIWGGMLRPALADINSGLESGAAGLKELYGAKPELSTARTGWQAGAEAGYEAFSPLTLGIRAGRLGPEQGRVKAVIDDQRYAPLLAVTGDSRETADTWGALALAGGRYTMPVDEGLDFNVGLFMGYGMTGLTYSEREDIQVATTLGSDTDMTDYILDAGGGAFAWEALVGMSWMASPQVAVGLDLGYRHLSTFLKASKEVDTNGDGVVDLARGDRLRDPAGDPLELDLSGVFFSVSLSYLFQP
jgi:hypothetical protein